MTGDQPIGREDELAAITAFVQAAPAGPAGMVLSGSAGIGKTILWLQGVSLAASSRRRRADEPPRGRPRRRSPTPPSPIC